MNRYTRLPGTKPNALKRTTWVGRVCAGFVVTPIFVTRIGVGADVSDPDTAVSWKTLRFPLKLGGRANVLTAPVAPAVAVLIGTPLASNVMGAPAGKPLALSGMAPSVCAKLPTQAAPGATAGAASAAAGPAASTAAAAAAPPSAASFLCIIETSLSVTAPEYPI